MRNKSSFPAMIVAVIVLILCCVSAAAFADSDHSGKVEVAVPESVNSIGNNGQKIEAYTVYYGGKYSVRLPVFLTDGTDSEYDLSGEISMISGPDEAKDAVYIDNADDGHSYYTVDPRNITESGAATYHILLETDHYFCEFDITYAFRPRSEACAHLAGDSIIIPLNQEINFNDLLHNGLLFDDFNYIMDVALYTPDQEVDVKNKDFELWFYYLKAKKAGEYPFKLAVNFIGTTIYIPVTVRAEAAISAIAMAGTPVKADREGVVEEPEQETRSKPVDVDGNDLAMAGQSEPSADSPISGESLLADAFNFADDFEDSNDNSDTSVLEAMNSKDDTPTEEINNQELTAEDQKQIAMGKLLEASQNGTFTEDKMSLSPLLETEFKTEQNLLFSYPVPAGFSQTENKAELPADLSGGDYVRIRQRYSDESGRYTIAANAIIYESKEFSEDPSVIRSYYDVLVQQLKGSGSVMAEREIMLDGGYPAYILCNRDLLFNSDLEMQDTYSVNVLYVRGSNSYIQLVYSVSSKPYAVFSDDSLPTIDDFISLISQVHYSVPEDKSSLPEWLLTADDFAFDLECSSDALIHTDGSTNQFSVKYRREDLAEKVQDLPKQIWSLLEFDAYTQGEFKYVDPSVATIDEKGFLKVLKVPEQAGIVVACSLSGIPIYQTRAIMVIPRVKKLTLNETKAELYAGESEPLILSAVAVPEGSGVFEADGSGNMAWSADKNDIVNVKDLGDGQASVEALAPGKVKVIVKDMLGGKQAVAMITVLTPVTGIEIEGPDTIAAGKGASYKVSLTPEKPSNKKVKWSLDVDGSVATIGNNGAVKVKKNVPSGTKITIICEAEGAAVPKTAKKEISVE